MRFGREVDPARLHLVGDGDGFDRTGERLQRVAQTDMAEQAPAGRRDGGSAPVETFRRQIGGIGAVDHVAGDPFGRRSQRQRHADEAATDYDQIAGIVLGHVGAP